MYTYCFVNDWIRYSLHSWLVKLLRPSEELEEEAQGFVAEAACVEGCDAVANYGGAVLFLSSSWIRGKGCQAVIILLVWRGWFREWHDPRFDPGFHVSGIVCVCIQWQEESSKQKKFWSVAAQDWAQGPLVVLCLKGLEPPRHRATKAMITRSPVGALPGSLSSICVANRPWRLPSWLNGAIDRKSPPLP